MGNWWIAKSGHIHRVRYFRKTKLLAIQFKDRDGNPVDFCLYAGVPWKIYMGLVASKSKGKYHASHIRNKPYSYWVIPEADARIYGLIP